LEKEKILILGGSGFIGNAIYKELCSYFDTYGTYYSPNPLFENNQQFIRYDLAEDDVVQLLNKLKPNVVISALRGSFASQVQAHQHIIEYVLQQPCKIIFLSSANVFDAYSKFPSYEYDKTLSESIYGRLKIKIENMLMRIPKSKMAILRLPMVFGSSSPRINQIKESLSKKEAVEVFPNLIMNVLNDTKLTQQIHYIINRKKSGIFHLGSTDLIHHDELIEEIIKKLGNHHPTFKRVYTTNNDRYLAVLPKDNLLPKNLRLNVQEIIDTVLVK
jgi:dTDP-4-dehydrorhamnose reductase